METMTWIVTMLLIATPLLATAALLAGLSTRKRRRAIHAAIIAALPGAAIARHDDCIEIATSEATYLIKVVPMNPAHELILTNRLFWCVNADLKNWKRSTKPNLVPRVKEFFDSIAATADKVVAIALVYPGCHRITRYLNECDVEVVRSEKPVDGVHFLTFDRFAEFFASREKKQ